MFRGSRLALITAVAVGLCMPLTRMDWFSSHEQSTYIVRTVEWAAELRAGHLYPRWAPDLYGGYGSPLFVFYAPALYSISGLLTAASADPVLVLKGLIVAASILSGVGAFALISGLTRDADAALLGSLAYLAAPYRIGDLFDRGDLSEFCCLALLPAVFALYLAAEREVRPLRARGWAVCAALLHSFMICMHTIMGLWGSALVGLVVLVRAVGLFRACGWRRVLPLAVALCCAPGLAGAYILPAMANRRLTHAADMVRGAFRPSNRWIPWTQLFDAHDPLFGRNFSRVGELVVVAVAIAVTGAVVNFKRGWSALAWLALSLALLCLVLPVGAPFWAPGRVPFSQFTQFPWRLLGPVVLTACVALGIGMAAATARLKEPLKNALAIGGGTALLLCLSWSYVSADPLARSQVTSDPDVLRGVVESTTGADEFLPVAVDRPPRAVRPNLFIALEDAQVSFSASDGSRHTMAVSATKPGATVHLGVYGFPGWKALTLAGPAKASLDVDRNGLLSVHFPSLGQYQVEVFYGQPPAAGLGFAVSLLSLVALSLMLLWGSDWWPSRLLAVRGGENVS